MLRCCSRDATRRLTSSGPFSRQAATLDNRSSSGSKSGGSDGSGVALTTMLVVAAAPGPCPTTMLASCSSSSNGLLASRGAPALGCSGGPPLPGLALANSSPLESLPDGRRHDSPEMPVLASRPAAQPLSAGDLAEEFRPGITAFPMSGCKASSSAPAWQCLSIATTVMAIATSAAKTEARRSFHQRLLLMDVPSQLPPTPPMSTQTRSRVMEKSASTGAAETTGRFCWRSSHSSPLRESAAPSLPSSAADSISIQSKGSKQPGTRGASRRRTAGCPASPSSFRRSKATVAWPMEPPEPSLDEAFVLAQLLRSIKAHIHRARSEPPARVRRTPSATAARCTPAAASHPSKFNRTMSRSLEGR
mmetsp:Transcript_18467/g.58688  ORF Transcript_18467/g.58688 Transcript_18467/m.58688 type:complete len:362 (+) Transcript_18467:410-1495(+)